MASKKELKSLIADLILRVESLEKQVLDDTESIFVEVFPTLKGNVDAILEYLDVEVTADRSKFKVTARKAKK